MYDRCNEPFNRSSPSSDPSLVLDGLWETDKGMRSCSGTRPSSRFLLPSEYSVKAEEDRFKFASLSRRERYSGTLVGKTSVP